MIAIAQTRVMLHGTVGRTLFTMGFFAPIIASLIGYTIYLVMQSNVSGSYKMVAIFISTIIYANLLSGLAIYYLSKK